MKENKGINVNAENLMVEGFNPDDYKQYYSDGTAYLPFKVQLLWFRKKYPNGKIPCFRPEWTPDKQVNTFVATARVYKDATDPVDAYLSEASAMRGPDVKIAETGESIDPYNAVQIAAMSLALKTAGFWCSLTEDDLTRELEYANPDAPAQDNTPEKKAGTPTGTTDKKGKKKEGGKKETKNGKGKEEPAPEAPSNEAEPMQEAPAEEPVIAEEPKAAGEPVADESPAEETPAEEVAEAPKEQQDTEQGSAEETANTEEAGETETPSEDTGEAQPEGEAEDKAESDNGAEAPVEEQAPTEGSAPAEELAPVEATDEEAESEADAEAEAQMEEPADAEPETDAPSGDEPETAAEVDEAALAEYRNTPFSCRYFTGTVGDLENGKLEGRDMETGLVKFLLTSKIAASRNPQPAAAMTALCEAIHKDWLKEEE